MTSKNLLQNLKLKKIVYNVRMKIKSKPAPKKSMPAPKTGKKGKC
jgi:hypothetical protein